MSENILNMMRWKGDHIIPWSKDGKSTQENWQMLYKRCNREKSGK